VTPAQTVATLPAHRARPSKSKTYGSRASRQGLWEMCRDALFCRDARRQVRVGGDSHPDPAPRGTWPHSCGQVARWCLRRRKSHLAQSLRLRVHLATHLASGQAAWPVPPVPWSFRGAPLPRRGSSLPYRLEPPRPATSGPACRPRQPRRSEWPRPARAPGAGPRPRRRSGSRRSRSS